MLSFAAAIQPSVTDVVHDRSGEQVHILQDDSQTPAKIRFSDLTDVDAVITDLSVGYIIKAVDEIGNGCLAGTGCANKGNLLPRFCV